MIDENGEVGQQAADEAFALGSTAPATGCAPARSRRGRSGGYVDRERAESTKAVTMTEDKENAQKRFDEWVATTRAFLFTLPKEELVKQLLRLAIKDGVRHHVIEPLYEGAIREAPAELAKRGGKGRAAKIAAVRAFAIEQFRSRTWRSVRQAAKTIFPAVLDEARRTGTHLTESSGEETLYRWLLDEKKQN